MSLGAWLNFIEQQEMISCFNRASISREEQPVSSDISHVNQQKKYPKCKFGGYEHVLVNKKQS